MSEDNVCGTSRCSKCRRRLPIKEFPRIERIGRTRTVGYHCYDCKNRIQREKRGFTPRKPQAERFWSAVNVGSPDECWEWRRVRQKSGYGRLRFNGSMQSAHRAAWLATHGAIPSGLCVCHRCDNRACCNPAHLFLGTNLENTRDMQAKGRQRNPRGDEHPRAKLSVSSVVAIREAYAGGDVSLRELADRWGVSESCVHDVVGRRRWQHVA